MQSGHRTRADIVVEILSPLNADYDRRTKSDTYRALGVGEMWLVDTEKKEIEVRSFLADQTSVYKQGENVRSRILRKTEIPISTIFPRT